MASTATDAAQRSPAPAAAHDTQAAEPQRARLTGSGTALALGPPAVVAGAVDGWLSPGLGIVFAAAFLPLSAWVARRALEPGWVVVVLAPLAYAAGACGAVWGAGAVGRGGAAELLAVLAAAAPALVGGIAAAAVGLLVGRASDSAAGKPQTR